MTRIASARKGGLFAKRTLLWGGLLALIVAASGTLVRATEPSFSWALLSVVGGQGDGGLSRFVTMPKAADKKNRRVPLAKQPAAAAQTAAPSSSAKRRPDRRPPVAKRLVPQRIQAARPIATDITEPSQSPSTGSRGVSILLNDRNIDALAEPADVKLATATEPSESDPKSADQHVRKSDWQPSADGDEATATADEPRALGSSPLFSPLVSKRHQNPRAAALAGGRPGGARNRRPLDRPLFVAPSVQKSTGDIRPAAQHVADRNEEPQLLDTEPLVLDAGRPALPITAPNNDVPAPSRPLPPATEPNDVRDFAAAGAQTASRKPAADDGLKTAGDDMVAESPSLKGFLGGTQYRSKADAPWDSSAERPSMGSFAQAAHQQPAPAAALPGFPVPVPPDNGATEPVFQNQPAAQPPAEPLPPAELPAPAAQPPALAAPAAQPPAAQPPAAQPPIFPPPAAQPPAPFQPQPGPAVADANKDDHFEVIEQSDELKVQVRRSKLLRSAANVYRTAVVDPTICDVVQFTPREVSVIGKRQGATHVTFWFQDARQPITYLIKVLPDVEEQVKRERRYELLEDMLAQLFPDSKVRLMLVADKLIVRGQAKDSEEATQIMMIVRTQSGGRSGLYGQGGVGSGGFAAEVLSEEATGDEGGQSNRRIRVINMLRVPGVQQVALRVKIAELNRTAARGFGLDIDGRINLSNNLEGSAVFLQSLLNASAGNAPALLTQFDGDDIQLGVRWLSQKGVLRLLSEPTLVTMSGKPATFVAGGEFAVPTVVGSAGLNAVTTDFRAFGVVISFVPTVVDKDRIRLQVAPEFSQINNNLNVQGTPGLNVRAVTTTVEMREGQTLAIAGLLEDSMIGTTVGDLPIISRIFGRREVNRNETELLILVTPELVSPMDPEEVPPLPGFDLTEPSNHEFYLNGDLEGNSTRNHRSTVWPRLRKRYGAGGPSMISGPFGHGQ